jgi:hypothetical protein
MKKNSAAPDSRVNFMSVLFLAGLLAGIPVLSPANFIHFDGGDYDGDRLADAIAIDNGDWYAWLSTAGYQLSTNMPDLARAGGNYALADFDGDRLVDCALAVQDQWYFWFSSSLYTNLGPFDLGVAGEQPLAADFDGDAKADPIMVTGNDFYAWLSGNDYLRIGPITPGFALEAPTCGDLDGDRLADFASMNGEGWHALLSGAGYQAVGPIVLGLEGLPVIADFDGDGIDDVATYGMNDEDWSILLSSAGYREFFAHLGGCHADTVAAMVIGETNTAYAYAYISDGFREITNATVRANDTLLTYGLGMIITNVGGLVTNVNIPVYHGQIAGAAAGSTVKISATNSAGATIYQSGGVVIPGQVVMTAPTNGQPLTAGQDVSVAWNEPAGAGAYVVSYLAPTAEDTGVEEQGGYYAYMAAPASQATIPGSATLAGEAWFEVDAMAGDTEVLNGSADFTNSFLIAAMADEAVTTIFSSGQALPIVNASQGLSIIKEYNKSEQGLTFKVREGNPGQIQQPGTISISFKLRRFKISVAFIKAYNMNGQEIFSWEKKRIMKSHDKKYHVDFGVSPGTTVVIGTHDANYRGGTYSY